jgi:hypothetical protein
MPGDQEIILKEWLVGVACWDVLVPRHRGRGMVVLAEGLDSSLV